MLLLFEDLTEDGCCTLVLHLGVSQRPAEHYDGGGNGCGTSSQWLNNKILLDYTRVEVHTVKLEFMQWRIDYTTPEGLVLLGDVMGQFIL